MRKGSNKRTKIVVIGLDGGSFDVINPLIDAGKLPNIASLMKEGASGELQSVIPPVTASAWVSFMTGTRPGKHSIFGFVGKVEEGYHRRILNYRSIKCKTIWQILTENDLKVGLFSVPFTFPPEKVTGFIVPEGNPMAKDASFTYPQNIWDEIKKEVDGVATCPDCLRYWFTDKKDALLRDFFKNIEKVKDGLSYLTNKYETDIFMTVFTDIDRVQHFFWKYTDESHPAYLPSAPESFKNSIDSVYQKVDEFIGQMMEKTEEDVYFMVVSDHGFGPNHKSVYINRWLQKLGLLTLKPSTYPLRRFKFSQGIYKLLFKLGLPYINPILFRDVEGELDDVEPRMSLNIYSMIDWSRTYAYSGHRSEQGIFINLKGREPKGVVTPGSEYEKMRDTIIENLSKLKDPEDGMPVADKIYKREEIYDGPYVEDAPDIVYKLKGYSCKGVEYLHHGEIFEDEKWLSGVHREDGIFILKGPHIKKNQKIEDARIIDMAPLILYLMGLPIPENMDGRLLTECLEDGFLNDHHPEIDRGASESTLQDDRIYSAEQEDKIKETLKSLGYID